MDVVTKEELNARIVELEAKIEASKSAGQTQDLQLVDGLKADIAELRAAVEALRVAKVEAEALAQVQAEAEAVAAAAAAAAAEAAAAAAAEAAVETAAEAEAEEVEAPEAEIIQIEAPIPDEELDDAVTSRKRRGFFTF
jgi:ribosomal protein L12E/L44/L45/RPP1/RPP2